MTLPEYPGIFGASTDPAKHAQLRTTQGVLAELSRSPDHNSRTRNGIVISAHLFDRARAAAWIAEARRLARSGSAERATTDTTRALWQAFANFWVCLNVCPYAWAAFRRRCEDLWGYPRLSSERGTLRVGRADVVDAEDEWHRRGIAWETVDYDAGDPNNPLWWRGRSLCWASPSGRLCRPGVWREAVAAMGRALNPAMEVTSEGALDGTNVYFGRVLPNDVGQSVGETRNGMPTTFSLQRPSTGEGHRFWLWNDGHVLTMPAPTDAARRPDGLLWPVIVGSPGAYAVIRQDAFIPDASDPLSWNQTRLFNVAVAPVIPPVAWYWDLLAGPVPGLRVDGEDEDISLVEYLYRASPGEVVREVQRDVLARNLTLMNPPGRAAMNDAELFNEGERASAARLQDSSAVALTDNERSRSTVSGVVTSATGIATAINPIAGVVVGAAGFVAIMLNKAFATQSVSSLRFVDVFGRLAPAYEQFAIQNNRPNLQAAIDALGMPSAEVVRASIREALEAASAELAGPVQRAETWLGAITGTDAGAATRTAGIRTVVLRGLDPVRGARILVGTRDVTTLGAENGRPARWQSSDDGPTWVQGVPELAGSITVVYPDGARRNIPLPPLPPEAEGEYAISARTVFVDATQGDARPQPSTQPQPDPTRPTPQQPNEGDVNNPVVDGAQEGYPPRTVVLVGMVTGTRVWALGADVTDTPMLSGDAAQWIDTTVEAGPATGWSFGVPFADVRRLELVMPDGSRRTVPLPPTTAQTVHDRVTVIDLRENAAPGVGGAYPARTLVLVGMPRDARVLVNGIDVTDTPMLTGDAARWIDSTLPGVQGWSFGVPNDTREVLIVSGATRQTVPLPTMDPALGVRDRVTVIDVRWAFGAGPSEASAAGGGLGWLLAAAVAGAGYYAFKGEK
jgi:hypothetical protein